MSTHTTRTTWRTLITLFVVAGALLVACRPSLAPGNQEVDDLALATYYAPVIYQGVATDQDYITRVDFDGDWISNNNWEHQPTGDLSAYVYYSVIETESHWFIFYSLFHPRDYESKPCDEVNGCHENDMESIQLAILKDGSRYGRLQAMETLAHGDIYLYVADENVQPGYLDITGPVLMEGNRPVVYVETYGHGIYGHKLDLKPGVVVYRVGEEAERPAGMNTQAHYRLLPIYEELWSRRESIGPGQTFDRPFFYGPNVIPAAFDGDDYGMDKANTPWGYDQATGFKLHRGDWFLDPAKAMGFHAHYPEPFSRRYVSNPYLQDLNLLSPEGESTRGNPSGE